MRTIRKLFKITEYAAVNGPKKVLNKPLSVLKAGARDLQKTPKFTVAVLKATGKKIVGLVR
jgi:hypothetical protein